jgi:hypothetical protein
MDTRNQQRTPGNRVGVACVGLACLGLLSSSACAKPDLVPPVATIAATVDRNVAAPGSPIVTTYVITPTAGTPLPDGYWLFVHMVDEQGEIVWTDDHQPVASVEQWRAGARVEYSRTSFVPRTPFTGQVHLEAGLFHPKSATRLPLRGGTDRGMQTYRLAGFAVEPGTEDIFVVFGEGWHDAESGSEGTGVSWRWSRGAATLSFRNPRRDAEFLLELDHPLAQAVEGLEVEVLAAGMSLGTFQVGGPKELLRLPLSQAAMGEAGSVELRLSVRPTFVPAALPRLRSIDSRELGVRVFNAHVSVR